MPSPDPTSPAEDEPVAIRRLGYTDLPQVVAMERRAFAMPWSSPMFVLEFSKSSSICLGAFLPGEDRLAGYAICSRYADVWHLMNIAVDPPLLRRGIGRRLLEAVIEQAGAEEPLTLEVRPSNAPAIALYEAFGFRAAGTRPRYYQDTGEDALIMWRVADRAMSAEPAP